jgi:hypothetical protein
MIPMTVAGLFLGMNLTVHAGATRLLIEQLGSTEFQKREEASKQLLATGEVAMPLLQLAQNNPDAEVAKRSTELFVQLKQQSDTARLIRPIRVVMPTNKRPWHELVAHLEDEAELSLTFLSELPSGLMVNFPAREPLPFWKALDTLCDLADQEITGLEPCLGPSPAKPLGYRITTKTKNPKASRAFTDHAVRLSPMALPAGIRSAKDSHSVILAAQPEFRVQLLRLDDVRVAKALDTYGNELKLLKPILSADLPRPSLRSRGFRGGVIREDEGGIAIVPNNAALTNFQPNFMQMMLRFQSPELPGPVTLAHLEGAFRATVRTPLEEIVRVDGIDKRGLQARVANSVNLSMQRIGNNATTQQIYIVSVIFNSGEWAFEKTATTAAARLGNLKTDTRTFSAVNGLSITDAEGHPFEINSSISGMAQPAGNGMTREQFVITLIPNDKTVGEATSVMLQGSRSKKIDIPFRFTQLPLHEPDTTAKP